MLIMSCKSKLSWFKIRAKGCSNFTIKASTIKTHQANKIIIEKLKSILRKILWEQACNHKIRCPITLRKYSSLTKVITTFYLKKIHLDLIKTGKKNMQLIRITNTFLYNNLSLENNKKILYLMLIHLYSKWLKKIIWMTKIKKIRIKKE